MVSTQTKRREKSWSAGRMNGWKCSCLNNSVTNREREGGAVMKWKKGSKKVVGFVLAGILAIGMMGC